MKQIFTIGYEGASVADFTATLKRSHISVLLDVRELPLSRRRGFSKNALREAVNSQGIDYRHERLLGSPKSIRHRLHEDGDYRAFFRAFRRHLSTQNGLLKRLVEELAGSVVLVCYERDYRACHRSIVADELSSLLNVTPVHLEVADGVSRKAHKAAHTDSCKGISPA